MVFLKQNISNEPCRRNNPDTIISKQKNKGY